MEIHVWVCDYCGRETRGTRHHDDAGRTFFWELPDNWWFGHPEKKQKHFCSQRCKEDAERSSAR